MSSKRMQFILRSSTGSMPSYAVSGLVYIVITLRYPRDLARVKQEKLQF